MLVRPISPPSSWTRVFLTESEKKALFKFDELLELDLRYIFECSQNASEGVHTPDINFKLHDLRTKDIHTAELVHVDGRAVFHLLFSSSATRAAHISPQ